jgi:uncharacterized membrane protein YfcA
MIGYLLAILIGFSLGLLGGGGSILTVPILVYVVGMEAKLSIALSLAIVGATSLVGVVSHTRAKNVDYKVAAIFGPIAMLGTFFGAKISQYLSGNVQLLIFSIIMLLASGFMLKGRKDVEAKENLKINIPLTIVQGLVVGIITGIVGVGGGFLIVPALVLIAGLSMRKAVGTSLFIIALNSFTGFFSYLGTVEVPWVFLGKFTAFSGVGIIIGSLLVNKVPQQKLKKVFAVFLIVMGFIILYKNL